MGRTAPGGRTVPAARIVLSFVLERVAWPPLSVCVFRGGKRGWEGGGRRCIYSQASFPSHLRSVPDTAPFTQVSELPRPGARGQSCAYAFSQSCAYAFSQGVLARSCPRGSGPCPRLMNISADWPVADGPRLLYHSGSTQGRVSLQVLGDFVSERFHVVWLPEYLLQWVDVLCLGTDL